MRPITRLAGAVLLSMTLFAGLATAATGTADHGKFKELELQGPFASGVHEDGEEHAR